MHPYRCSASGFALTEVGVAFDTEAGSSKSASGNGDAAWTLPCSKVPRVPLRAGSWYSSQQSTLSLLLFDGFDLRVLKSSASVCPGDAAACDRCSRAE